MLWGGFSGAVSDSGVWCFGLLGALFCVFHGLLCFVVFLGLSVWSAYALRDLGVVELFDSGVLGFRQLGGFGFCFGCLRLVGCFVGGLVVLADFGGCLLGG